MNIKNKNELEKRLKDSNKVFSKTGEIYKESFDKIENLEIPFAKSNINIDFIDYYFTNHIARSSLTMNECRSIKNKTSTNTPEG